MHMSDALVSAAVGTTMAAVSTGMIGYSVKKINNSELSDNKIPMMGVMGAFVFAAQMINFTIPGTGSSGHIGGGILLAALLGPYPAFLTLASVLIIQALFFADGGLLALGCNIFNIAFFSCLVVHPFIFRPIMRKAISSKRIMTASILAVTIGLQLGAIAVVIETTISGVTDLPFTAFIALMQPIHLVIGIIEGIATGAVLSFVYGARKEIIINALKRTDNKKASKKLILISFVIATIFFGGFLSLYASTNPDGLEWSIQSIVDDSVPEYSSQVHEKAKELQDKTAILPDYSFVGENQEIKMGTSISGIAGAGITLAVTVAVGFAIRILKKNKKNQEIRKG